VRFLLSRCAHSRFRSAGTSSLAGRSVVVTREAGKNGPLVRRLEQLGIKASARRRAGSASACCHAHAHARTRTHAPAISFASPSRAC
jgi:hypothetical protein